MVSTKFTVLGQGGLMTKLKLQVLWFEADFMEPFQSSVKLVYCIKMALVTPMDNLLRE